MYKPSVAPCEEFSVERSGTSQTEKSAAQAASKSKIVHSSLKVVAF